MAGETGRLQDCCNPLLAVSQIVDYWWQECKEIGQNLWILVKIHIKSFCLHQMIPYRYGQNISPSNVLPYQFAIHKIGCLHEARYFTRRYCKSNVYTSVKLVPLFQILIGSVKWFSATYGKSGFGKKNGIA